MERPVDDILQTVGGTPVVRLQRVVPPGSAAVFAKLEQFNPSSSLEDRLAAALLDRASVDGLLKRGGTAVDAATPDLAIALTLACAVRGYPLHTVVQDDLTREKRMLLKSSGFRVTFSPASEGEDGAIRRARQVASETAGGFSLLELLRERVAEHAFRGVAEEVIEAAEAEHLNVDAWVAPSFPQGHFIHIARGLKSRYPRMRQVEVAMEDGGSTSARSTDGTEIVQITSSEAWKSRARLGREEGILSGISSGAVLCAALKTAGEIGPSGCVFALFPDTGERYFSLAGKMG